MAAKLKAMQEAMSKPEVQQQMQQMQVRSLHGLLQVSVRGTMGRHMSQTAPLVLADPDFRTSVHPRRR